MQTLFEILINGLSLGSIYALIALGFVLIYKSTGIINFAQGEFAMFGAYICFALTVNYQLPYVTSLFMTIAFCSLLGIILEYFIFRRMVGEPLFSTIMITLGLSNILVSFVGLVWGHEAQAIQSPFIGSVIEIGQNSFPMSHIYIISATVFLVTVFVLIFRYSSVGLAMRTTSEDQDTAQLMGINLRRYFTLSWIIGSVVAGIGGVFLAEQTMVYRGMGAFGIGSFAAAIVGGMDSIPGAILGGVIMGFTQYIVGIYFGGVAKAVIPFVVLIVVLIIRPYGLLGTEEIERV